MVAWLHGIAFDGGPPVQCTNSVSYGGSIIVLQYVPLHGNRCRITRFESGIVVNEVPAMVSTEAGQVSMLQVLAIMS